MTQIKTGQRLHGIDALRAIAMILGIFLHAMIAYKAHELPNWPHDAAYNSPAYDYLYLTIHTFRMPLFFLIAGFFCRFLILKIGIKQFVKHRWKRIIIPFILSLILILPLTIFPFLLYGNISLFPNDWSANFKYSFKQLFQWNGMAHLWFLYYLIIYYFFIIGLTELVRLFKLDKVVGMFYHHWKQFYYSKILLFVVAIFCLWIILILNNEIFISVHTGVVPRIPYLAFYGLFFVIGWMINVHDKVFKYLEKNTWLFLIPGVFLSGITYYFEFYLLANDFSTFNVLLFKALISIQIMCLVFGIIGVFLRYFKSESRFWRYISDASYWMYLIHLALVASFQILFMHIGLPGLLRFWTVLTVTLSVTLITYHFFVRYTIIGFYLHGHRKKIKHINL